MNARRSFHEFVAIMLVSGISCILLFITVQRKSSAEEPVKENMSPIDAAAYLEKKLHRAVMDLDYPEQVAKDFVSMVRPWKCEALYLKLAGAAAEVKRQKMSSEQYAQTEEKIANELADRIIKEFTLMDTSIDANLKYLDLSFVVAEKKSQCLGCTQVFYLLGNIIGLNVRATSVLEHRYVVMKDIGHTACLIGLRNGKALQADLTVKQRVGNQFTFAEEYADTGPYLKVRNESNPFDLHPKIQLLDFNGLRATIHDSRSGYYTLVNRLEDALAESNKAIEFAPKESRAYFNRGLIYYRKDQLVDSLKDLSKAIEIDPELPQAFKLRGIVYGCLGKPKENIADLSKAIEIWPKYSDAYSCRGLTYSLLGQTPKAIEDFNKAIEYNPQDDVSFMRRGEAYAKLGKKEDAVNDLRKALELNSNSKEPVKQIADRYKLKL